MPTPSSTGDPTPVCATCGGDGWILDHEDDCYEQGDCNCSGIQVECPTCGGRDRPYEGIQF